ncbi:hypothetical protein [Clostridium saccharoperbutylacetonicum]|uniref:hypothetical protein n=1 Tax=Clostridium saccharoperbutylacetonicum TaxID=36745 RepID=UPI0039E8970C
MAILSEKDAKLKAYDMLIEDKEKELIELEEKINCIKIKKQIKSIANEIESNGTKNAFINTKFEVENQYLLKEQIKMVEDSIKEVKESRERFEEQ